MSGSAPGWFESLPVRGKLTVVLTVQLVVLTIGCACFMVGLHQLKQARDWATHTHRVIEQVESLRTEAVEQQTGVRGYVITGNIKFLDPYLTSRVEFETVAAATRELLRDNPTQFDRYSRIVFLMKEWQTQVAEHDVADVPVPERRHLAVERTSRGEGKRRIDALKQLCSDMIATERDLLVQREINVERIQHTLIALIALLLLIGWLTGINAVSLVQRMLGDPLFKLAQLVPRLGTGEAVDVPFTGRRDEVGILAGAFVRMRDAHTEQRLRDWVTEQSAQLIGTLQHCENDSAFGDVLVSRLCRVLDGGYGLAYRWNDESAMLEWCAAYGLPDDAITRRRFRLGEGMVGQCMVERRILELSPVPEGYSRIVSGLGAALPHTVLFAPLTARGQTVAVLEIGLLNAFRREQREFLEQALVTSGLAWHSVSRGVRTRELLEESQTQTEELTASQEALRAQQEQLRAVNETLRSRGEQLEAQGRRLKTSEEEQRAQAEELRVTNSALEEKTETLRLRQSELEHAREALERKAGDLEQASRYKSEFLANMSHELRTPLNSMLILSKMLADNSDGNLDAEQIESARIMYDSGKSLLSLINDILDLSKVEAGKMALTLEDVKLADLMQSLLERFRPLAGERGLKFGVRIAPGAPELIRTDGERLAQVLTNLLSNAFKFTHEGEIELIVEATQDGVALSVRDTGIGIPADKLERVFQAFEQADAGTSRRYGGTGLGLSIVNGMTMLLRGSVRAESREGEGSRFTILLPLAADAPAAKIPSGAPTIVRPSNTALRPAVISMPASEDDDTPTVILQPKAPQAPGGNPVLMVVEDDAAFARVLADIGTKRGLEVMIAGSGKEALAIAQKRRLSGVLLDIGLPDISGWEVLAQLKADPHTSEAPVHIISGNEEGERGLALGAVGFMRKPVTREAVLQALERVDGAAPGPLQRRILIVDHDQVAREEARSLLSGEKAQIVEAVTAEEGLRLLSEQRFDGVILDPDLPDAPDLNFLARAAERVTLPPVVIYSRRELTPDENLRLREYTGSIVIHGARSSERLLDEVHLFLHAIKRPGPAHATPVAHAPIADLAGKTVLVVDDDMRNVFALSKALRTRGLSVVMAQDGHKALAQLESRSDVDLVLMDIMMPGMDGFETIRRIRAREQWLNLPIIAVTAKAMKADLEKCLEAGANDYCPKPIDMEQLVSQLQVWI